jgi:hypothetical protein
LPNREAVRERKALPSVVSSAIFRTIEVFAPVELGSRNATSWPSARNESAQ